MAKILLWDLECSNLSANFGHIICGGIKELGSKNPVKLYSITDSKQWKPSRPSDKNLVKDIRDHLSTGDMFVTWYGGRFDIPFLNTRLLLHGYAPLPPIPHVDGWRVAKDRLRLNSNRLASVSAFLGLQDKTPLLGPTWQYAAAGDPESIRYVKKHCARDVLVLEEAYKRILPLISNHPNLTLTDAAIKKSGRECPKCGAAKLQARGVSVTRTKTVQRYQCQECGGWSLGPPKSPGYKVIAR